VEREAERAGAAARLGAPAEKQILFGDLHVHTTFSADAFLYALPILGGEGAHPPADACDFARWCAGLDFFSINDHAEGLTPAFWEETKRSIRECDARAAAERPDLVPFLGWEWTQTGATAETHFGHRNVVLESLAEDAVPARPIASRVAEREGAPPPFLFRIASAVAHVVAPGPYAALVDRFGEMAGVPVCPDGTPVRELPSDCLESAATPGDLFRKLDEWGMPALVIPHGLAWGIHAPPDADLRTQLRRAQHDPRRERLLEVMSGHGNGEEYRAALAAGGGECAEPTQDFLPCCWRAGELMRERCGSLPPAECDARVAEAKRLALEAGAQAHRVIPGTTTEDWLDCDQCRDCFKPASFLRPRLTAQYAAALTNEDESDDAGRPLRFRFGFIASTDTHGARAGSGYKQVARQAMTDQRGPPSADDAARVERWVLRAPEGPGPVRYEPSRLLELFDGERTASFLYPGGIVAVHAAGRGREAIWAALERREVYGTSGPRILLWFDLVNGPAGRAPMGSELRLAEAPRFEVRAAGARVQRPGCPDEATRALSPERLHSLCVDECYHPGDERHPIVAIEVVRIRPQRAASEGVAALIEDPWLRLPCAPDPAGCAATFEDREFSEAARDAVYYVRALQAETPAINGANLRTAFDEEGRPLSVAPCSGGYRTPAGDDCLAPVQERAWSSPIYVDFAADAAPGRSAAAGLTPR
jgi:hypothetical protein